VIGIAATEPDADPRPVRSRIGSRELAAGDQEGQGDARGQGDQADGRQAAWLSQP
jgi:hypothetical protein